MTGRSELGHPWGGIRNHHDALIRFNKAFISWAGGGILGRVGPLDCHEIIKGPFKEGRGFRFLAVPSPVYVYVFRFKGYFLK